MYINPPTPFPTLPFYKWGRDSWNREALCPSWRDSGYMENSLFGEGEK